MSIKSVLSKYLIVEASDVDLDWKQDLALTMLSDAISSAVEGEEGEKEFPGLREEIIRPQTDIVENVQDLADELKIDLRTYLDTGLIDKIATEVEKRLGVTLESIYEEDEHAAHRVVLNVVGHGVSPFDDDEFDAWLEEKSGKTQEDWQGHQHFEGPLNQAMDFCDEAVKKMASSEE